MNSVTDVTVRKMITVEASRGRAFDVFVNQLSRWWPLESSIVGEKPDQAAIVEPHGRPLVRARQGRRRG